MAYRKQWSGDTTGITDPTQSPLKNGDQGLISDDQSVPGNPILGWQQNPPMGQLPQQPPGATPFGMQRSNITDPTQSPLNNGGPQDPNRIYRGGSPAFNENIGAPQPSAQPFAQPAPQPSPTAAPVGRTSGFFSTNEADNALPNWDLMPGQSRADHPFPGANSAGAPNNGSGYAAGMGPPVSGPGSAGSATPYSGSPTSFGGSGGNHSSAYPSINSPQMTGQFGFSQSAPNTMMASQYQAAPPQQVAYQQPMAQSNQYQPNINQPQTGKSQAMGNALGNWGQLGYKPSWVQ